MSVACCWSCWPVADVRLSVHMDCKHVVRLVRLLIYWQEPGKGELARFLFRMHNTMSLSLHSNVSAYRSAWALQTVSCI